MNMPPPPIIDLLPLSRALISKGRGNNQENSFPQGVNILPDEAKQLFKGC